MKHHSTSSAFVLGAAGLLLLGFIYFAGNESPVVTPTQAPKKIVRAKEDSVVPRDNILNEKPWDPRIPEERAKIKALMKDYRKALGEPVDDASLEEELKHVRTTFTPVDREGNPLALDSVAPSKSIDDNEVPESVKRHLTWSLSRYSENPTPLDPRDKEWMKEVIRRNCIRRSIPVDEARIEAEVNALINEVPISNNPLGVKKTHATFPMDPRNRARIKALIIEYRIRHSLPLDDASVEEELNNVRFTVVPQ